VRKGFRNVVVETWTKKTKPIRGREGASSVAIPFLEFHEDAKKGGGNLGIMGAPKKGFSKRRGKTKR